MQSKETASKRNYVVWLLPLAFIVIQCTPSIVGLALAGLFLLLYFLWKPYRQSLLLLLVSVCGYLVWAFLSPKITAAIEHPELSVIVSRLGLIGYILFFGVWQFLAKPKVNLLQFGEPTPTIQFPFIWKGKREPIWRFILIFCLICTSVFVGALFKRPIALVVLLYGLLFSVLNALLEEVIWRGFITSRAMDVVGEQQALVLTAVSFGIYHLSLGFAPWVCAIFAIGGFYMGGAAIKSKGLLAPFIMHVFVNMIFVAFGLIF